MVALWGQKSFAQKYNFKLVWNENGVRERTDSTGVNDSCMKAIEKKIDYVDFLYIQKHILFHAGVSGLFGDKHERARKLKQREKRDVAAKKSIK